MNLFFTSCQFQHIVLYLFQHTPKNQFGFIYENLNFHARMFVSIQQSNLHGTNIWKRLHVMKLPHTFLPLAEHFLLPSPPDDTVESLKSFLLVSARAEKKGGVDGCTFDSLRPGYMPSQDGGHGLPTYIHMQRTLWRNLMQEGPDQFMNIDRVCLAECWVSCRTAVFTLPNCLNVFNTSHYKDSVKEQSPSADGSALLPTGHLAQVLLVPTGRDLAKAYITQVELRTLLCFLVGATHYEECWTSRISHRNIKHTHMCFPVTSSYFLIPTQRAPW